MPKRISTGYASAAGALLCVAVAGLSLTALAQPAAAQSENNSNNLASESSNTSAVDPLSDIQSWRHNKQAAAALQAIASDTKLPLTAGSMVSVSSQRITVVDSEWLTTTAKQTGIPERTLQAYQGAALSISRSNPGCQITWVTLAGVGSVESNHGRHGGSEIGPDGNTTVPILGPVLDGNGFAGIRDTDAGMFDGDKQWDRAVGPMQFIPSTWARWGTDADGDGKANPSNIDDAAMSAGRYLCASGGSLASSEGWLQAILSYNHSIDYTRSVRSAADGYATAAGVATVPVEPPLSDQDKKDGGRDEGNKDPAKPADPAPPTQPAPSSPPTTPMPTEPPVTPPVTPPTTPPSSPPTEPPATPPTSSSPPTAPAVDPSGAAKPSASAAAQGSGLFGLLGL